MTNRFYSKLIILFISVSHHVYSSPIYDNLSTYQDRFPVSAVLGPFEERDFVQGYKFVADHTSIFGSIELLARTNSVGSHLFSFGIYRDSEDEVGELLEEIHFLGPSRDAPNKPELLVGSSPTRNTTSYAGEAYWIVGSSNLFASWAHNLDGDTLLRASSEDGGASFDYISGALTAAFRINSDVPIPSTPVLLLGAFACLLVSRKLSLFLRNAP